MNHTYLQYWQQTTDNINLLTNLVKTNIEEYQRTQDIEYIEYILECLSEIIRLIPLQREFYEKAFIFD